MCLSPQTTTTTIPTETTQHKQITVTCSQRQLHCILICLKEIPILCIELFPSIKSASLMQLANNWLLNSNLKLAGLVLEHMDGVSNMKRFGQAFCCIYSTLHCNAMMPQKYSRNTLQMIQQ